LVDKLDLKLVERKENMKVVLKELRWESLMVDKKE
jgi:hypothetical protein